ncbi:hypothetical protein [Parapedobacter tibetensis]|uniref:hypothetical protein n=1 Tax=Parapedobacter tibetensis TaxID=2972951 RepID=UPI00214D8D40|nr:hypothetical protein [Parapedobacter tibetensis]
MKPEHPPLLRDLAAIFILEQYWERLLPLVQQENKLGTTLECHDQLAKRFPQEMLDLYLPQLEAYGLATSNRSEYTDLVRTMKQVIKTIPEGRDDVLAVARRPAMLEELGKLV